VFSDLVFESGSQRLPHILKIISIPGRCEKRALSFSTCACLSDIDTFGTSKSAT
jgi:hypothetical protein